MLASKNSIYLVLSVIIISLFFVSCSTHRDRVIVKKTEDIVKKTIKIKKHSDQNSSLIVESSVAEIVAVELTPIEKCKKDKNRYNLIVDAPFGSIVRIMNIKPRYKDCIALKKGRYHIEVTRDGFKEYNRWISLNDHTNVDIKLEKIVKIDKAKIEKNELKKAGYNKKALENFIRKYPQSDSALIANNRVGIIKNKFRSYSPNSLIKSNNCTGFYPKNLVEKNLNISISLDYWNSIRWSGTCKNSLMAGRGVLYFKSDKGLYVELKGKMKNGFFEGKVYNYSRAKEKASYINGSGIGSYIVKLKNRFDFIRYQK